MSEINENIKEIDTQINNLNGSIIKNTNEIEQFQRGITSLSNTPQNKKKNKFQIKLLQNRILLKQRQIEENKQHINNLKQFKEQLNRPQQMLNSKNPGVNNKQKNENEVINPMFNRARPQQILNSNNPGVNQQEEQKDENENENENENEVINPMFNRTRPQQMLNSNNPGVNNKQENENEVINPMFNRARPQQILNSNNPGVNQQEEQGEIYDGNKIPTPDDEYIPSPVQQQEDENEVINPMFNKAQINGPREIEMSKLGKNINLGNPIMTRKYRGTLPQGRLKTLKPLQKQLTRRKSISNAGFSETIIQKLNRPTGPMTINMKICPTILDTGKKVNNKYFIPSQFPNLTKPKQLVQNISKKSNKINTKQKNTLKKIKKLNKTKNK